ncbi:sterol desaturase family protein [Halomonas denitrificans]|nr:sterol desaturase family protein [Halomonas denitrificans]
MPASLPQEPDSPIRALASAAGQPLLLLGTLALWLALGADEAAIGLSWLALVGVVGALEHIVPLRPAERPTLSRRAIAVLTGLVLAAALGVLGAVYEQALRPAFAPIAGSGPGALWPDALHWSVQAVLLYLLADGLNYGLHRACHRWNGLWRISGHGVHHSFHALNSYHAVLTHPLELFFLAVPMAVAAALFGVDGQVVAASTVLIASIALLAHANLDLHTPGLEWIVTQPGHHRLHHSIDAGERESNYACTAILWDRLFGTYDGRAAERTGLDPEPPTLLDHVLRPFRRARD